MYIGEAWLITNKTAVNERGLLVLQQAGVVLPEGMLLILDSMYESAMEDRVACASHGHVAV